MGLLVAPSLPAQEKITFTDHVLPLVEQHCAKCHNPDKKKGDLDLTTFAGTLKGGGSGAVVVSGNPDSSKLIKSLAHSEEPTMPPNKPPLPDKEQAVFKKWIAGGLLESSGSKAVAAARPAVDLTLKISDAGKPEGPPPMPKDLLMEPVVHAMRAYAINGLASSPWAPVVATTGQKQILLYNSTNLDLLGILPFAEGQPVDVKFSRSGKLLAAGGGHAAKSGKVVLWNVETGERVATVGNEYDAVLASDITPDQTRVALGGPDRLVKVYSTSGELLHKIKKHTDWVTALAFSPNGEMLASADRNGGVTVWDAESGQELFTTAGHKGAVTAVSWRSDSRVLATSSEDGTVKLWEAAEGKQAKTWNAHAGGVLSVSYSRDGRFVTCGRDGAVTVWTADGAKSKALEFSGETVVRCAWTADDTRVVAGDFQGRLAVWDAKDGKRVGDLDSNPLPLEVRIRTLQQRLQEIERRGDKPPAELAAAEAQVVKTEKELGEAKVAAARAQERFSMLAAEVVKLKELAARPERPAEVEAQLASARSAREEARGTRSNTTNQVAVLDQTLAKLKHRVDELRKSSSDPASELAAAKAELSRLTAAQARASRQTKRAQGAAAP